jgi:uncharacterized membrane protein
VSAAAPTRQASIDVLRATAIVLMVVVHFVENLSGWHGQPGSVFTGVHGMWWLPTGFAAPAFTFLAGVSYRFWLDAQRQRGRPADALAKATVRRGLFLIGLGFAFNVLVWLPEDIFNWDILTLIGCALLALEALRRAADGVLLLAATASVAVAPAMRIVCDYPSYWTGGFFDYEFTVADVVLGWLVTGYFPVFPWLAYPLAGFALAPGLLLNEPAQQPARGFLMGLGLMAGAAILVAAWPALPTAVTGGATAAWTMFPASTAYVSGTLGCMIAALAVLHRLLDGDPARCRWLVAWAGPLSRHSLSIYLLHHVAHVWPLWAAGLIAGGDASAFWQVAMPPAASLALALAFLLAAAVVCRWADGRRLPTAESLMRWLCD